ncbi:hypothetical protein N8D56_24635 [Devosia sp. A8/3-2]|nr:hypothetical protein N8D56_24635 [Devosia sp. A8/3-2]
MLRFAGHNFEPLPSGALYWRAEASLLVADLHLEKMGSFARAGQLLPPYDTGLTLRRLEADLRRTGAQRLISLGDSFHRVDASSLLTNSDRMHLDALTDLVDFTGFPAITIRPPCAGRKLPAQLGAVRSDPVARAAARHFRLDFWALTPRRPHLHGRPLHPPPLLRARQSPADPARLWQLHRLDQHFIPALCRAATLAFT